MGKTRAQREKEEFLEAHSSARLGLQSAIKSVSKAQAEALPAGSLSSKQEPEEGGFNKNVMDTNNLLTPSYDPSKLYSIVENSQILPQCIDAMVQNIHGFGYDFEYTGDTKENDIPEVEVKEKDDAANFLKKVNEAQSITALNREVHEDLEKTGNGYMEIVRDNTNRITLMYKVDARLVRLQRIQPDAVPVKTEFFRYGKPVTLVVYKRFRRFAMLHGKSGNKTNIVWFKEFGDPRPMDKYTGSYEKVTDEASEILHFKLGNDVYGIPRWSGQTLVTLGMHYAEFVNYDLFSNQVVPPLAILVSGGVLTAASVNDIKNTLVAKRGVYNFNKVLVLESESKGTISEKDSARIDLKELSQARKEDAMFTEYTSMGEGKIRSAFKLPPMMVGRAESYSKSTADSSKQVAEEQVFVPERRKFDGILNTLIMPELGLTVWAYKSQTPRMIRSEDVKDIFNSFARFGAFTINQSIRLANKLLSTDLTTYDTNLEWANLPVSIVLEYARQGVLDIGDLNTAASNMASIIADPENVDDPEKAALLYRNLTQLTSKLTSIQEEQEKLVIDMDM